jgi:hypothetical protein
VPQFVRHACNEWCLWPDHDEVGVERTGEIEQALAVLGAHRMAVAERRYPWVPRGRMQLLEAGRSAELPRERVLAASGTDQQDPHGTEFRRAPDGVR